MKNIGLTLIELMISLTLSVVIGAILFDCYHRAHISLNMQSSIYQLQASANTVFDAIVSEIQQAGYIGCAHIMPGFPIYSDGEDALSINNQLEVKDNYFISRHASYINVALIQQSNNLHTLYVGDEIKFKTRDKLIISDCLHAEIFQVRKIYHLQHQQKLETLTPLHSMFAEGAEIAYFEVNRYFVAPSTHKFDGGHWVSTFNVDSNQYGRRQLQDGIEQMRLQSIMSSGKLQGVGFTLWFHLNDLRRQWHGYVKTI